MGVIAKQSIRGTAVTYIGVAVGFVTTFFVLTRFLTAEEIGLARVLIDAATLFVGLAQLGTTSSIIRFYPYFKSSDRSDNGFFFWTMLVPFIGFALFSLLWWACHTPLAAWFGDKSPLFIDYYYFVLPLALGMLYQTVFETNANVRMHIVVPRAVRELLVRVGLLVCYLLYAFRILSLDGFVIALCINYALAALVNAAYLFRLGAIQLRPDIDFLRTHPDIVRRYLLYTGFLLVSALASVLAPTLSSFFITAQMGLDYTGIFAIATYMAVMVSIPYRSLTAIAAPQLAAAINDNDRAQTSRLMQQAANNLLLIGGFILLAIWVNIDLIFHILPNGQFYSQARTVVLILGLSQLILGTFNITLNTLNYSRYYAFSLLWSVLLTTTAILCNNLLIPRFGMNGAALSNLISYALYFVGVIATLALTCRTHPFCRTQLLTLAILAFLFVINELWCPYCPDNIWLSSILRSFVLLGSGLLLAYRLRLSPEINALIR